MIYLFLRRSVSIVPISSPNLFPCVCLYRHYLSVRYFQNILTRDVIRLCLDAGESLQPTLFLNILGSLASHDLLRCTILLNPGITSNKQGKRRPRDEAYILRICDRIERSVIDIVTSSFLIMRLRIY